MVKCEGQVQFLEGEKKGQKQKDNVTDKIKKKSKNSVCAK